ncbi:MAG: intradiol ring-cleavage dioxygenase [Cyanobacteria bacterium J06631_12]
MDKSRRLFLQLGPGAAASFALATCGRLPSANSQRTNSQLAQGTELSPTPACGAESATPRQTAGPFYTPNSPERSSLLEPSTTGTVIILTGQVLSSSCTPIANTLLDFWHTDDQGQYDNTGYTLRGHQFTDAQGRYRLETIMPGIYPGRTRHFHVKVQAPGKDLLTTQLYFPGEALNSRDGLYQPELLVAIEAKQEATQPEKQATFSFVL